MQMVFVLGVSSYRSFESMAKLSFTMFFGEQDVLRLLPCGISILECIWSYAVCMSSCVRCCMCPFNGCYTWLDRTGPWQCIPFSCPHNTNSVEFPLIKTEMTLKTHSLESKLICSISPLKQNISVWIPGYQNPAQNNDFDKGPQGHQGPYSPCLRCLPGAMSEMAPYSLYSAHILTRTLWAPIKSSALHRE